MCETGRVERKLKIGIVAGTAAAVAAASVLAWHFLFTAPQKEGQQKLFTVGLRQDEGQIIDKLASQGLIRNKAGFGLVLTIRKRHGQIQPGGYELSPSLTAWQLADKLTAAPELKWVVILEGWRKEQIGELLQKTFGWSDEELKKWDTVYTNMNIDYIEGTYFPDTYLIPVGESGLDIAKRMTRNFDERFAPYVSRFAQENIKWTTGLRLASIIQREAAGKGDMPLIAGILWNRLNTDMNLDIDATVQYARGNTGAGWWAPVTAEDIRNIDSPYNTYKYKGLPPYPICNPGLDAIAAVLEPAQTDCLYYLHDHDRQIHCAATLEEHQANIDQYLKNQG